MNSISFSDPKFTDSYNIVEGIANCKEQDFKDFLLTEDLKFCPKPNWCNALISTITCGIFCNPSEYKKVCNLNEVSKQLKKHIKTCLQFRGENTIVRNTAHLDVIETCLKAASVFNKLHLHVNKKRQARGKRSYKHDIRIQLDKIRKAVTSLKGKNRDVETPTVSSRGRLEEYDEIFPKSKKTGKADTTRAATSSTATYEERVSQPNSSSIVQDAKDTAIFPSSQPSKFRRNLAVTVHTNQNHNILGSRTIVQIQTPKYSESTTPRHSDSHQDEPLSSFKVPSRSEKSSGQVHYISNNNNIPAPIVSLQETQTDDLCCTKITVEQSFDDALSHEQLSTEEPSFVQHPISASSSSSSVLHQKPATPRSISPVEERNSLFSEYSVSSRTSKTAAAVAHRASDLFLSFSRPSTPESSVSKTPPNSTSEPSSPQRVVISSSQDEISEKAESPQILFSKQTRKYTKIIQENIQPEVETLQVASGAYDEDKGDDDNDVVRVSSLDEGKAAVEEDEEIEQDQEVARTLEKLSDSDSDREDEKRRSIGSSSKSTYNSSDSEDDDGDNNDSINNNNNSPISSPKETAKQFPSSTNSPLVQPVVHEPVTYEQETLKVVQAQTPKLQARKYSQQEKTVQVERPVTPQPASLLEETVTPPVAKTPPLSVEETVENISTATTLVDSAYIHKITVNVQVEFEKKQESEHTVTEKE